MGDHEVEINGKKFGENSKVTLSVKTLAWILGGLFFVISTLATIGYIDIKNGQADLKKDSEKSKLEYREEIKLLLKEELKDLRDKDVKFIEDIGEMKGDIKVILDRTMRNNDHNNTGNITPVNNSNLPDVIPTTVHSDRNINPDN